MKLKKFLSFNAICMCTYICDKSTYRGSQEKDETRLKTVAPLGGRSQGDATEKDHTSGCQL